MNRVTFSPPYTLRAQRRATISRAHLPLTQALSSVAKIKTQLSRGHMEQPPFNPNGIRVAHLEQPPHSQPANATNSVQTGQSAQAEAQLISCQSGTALFNPHSASPAQAQLQLVW